MADAERDIKVNLEMEVEQTDLSESEASWARVEAAALDYEAATKKTSASAVASVKRQEVALEELEKQHKELLAQQQMQSEKLSAATGEAMKLARSLAFVGAAGSDSAQDLMQMVSIAQAGMDTFTGLQGSVRTLAILFPKLTVAMGPWGIALSALAAVVTAAIAAYRYFTQTAEEARKAQEELREQGIEKSTQAWLAHKQVIESVKAPLEKYATSEEKLIDVTNKLRESRMNLAFAMEAQNAAMKFSDSLATQSSASERALYYQEQQVSLQEKYIEQIRIANEEQRKGVETQLDSLKAAEAVLEAESKRVQTIEELVGRLTAAQRKELDILLAKIEQGKASDAELKRAEALGGQSVKGRTGQIYADRGAAADPALVDRLAALDRNDREIEKAKRNALKAMDETGTDNTQQAREALLAKLRELKDEQGKTMRAQVSLLDDMMNDVILLKGQLSRIKQAQEDAKARAK